MLASWTGKSIVFETYEVSDLSVELPRIYLAVDQEPTANPTMKETQTIPIRSLLPAFILQFLLEFLLEFQDCCLCGILDAKQGAGKGKCLT